MNAKDWKKYLEIDPELLPIWRKYQVDFERLLNPVIAEIRKANVPIERIHFYPHKVFYEGLTPEYDFTRIYLDFDIYVNASDEKYGELLDYGKITVVTWRKTLSNEKRRDILYTRLFVIFPDTDQDMHEIRKERYGFLIDDNIDAVEFQRKIRKEWDDREKRLWGNLFNE